MKKPLFLIASFLLLSCTKAEFAANKINQSKSINAVTSYTHQLCSQSTLVSPKVDVLLLWDNSSSAFFINPQTKDSFKRLISSVSENFDYHILSAPLIATDTSNTLHQASLVVKDPTSVSGGASAIVRSKDQASAALGFSPATGSMEPGIDRATSLIEANRANGIFRDGAYTIIVVMSNGDDTSCEAAGNYPYGCSEPTWKPQVQSKINKLLCLRGNANASINCAGTTTLNSSMMRFINISALTTCTRGDTINKRYREVAKTLYEAPYTNAWPTPTDNLSPFISSGISYPDNYNICSSSFDFNRIFDGVNTAIKQTLLAHKYDFWPAAGSNESLDPDTLRVTRVDINGTNTDLVNNTAEVSPSNGFKYIGVQSAHSTRFYPTTGEYFTGKMVQLFGADQLTYPNCLKVTYSEIKSNYGYIYLTRGEPYTSSIVVKKNGVVVPQDASNGWDYMGLQDMAALDMANYKVVDFPYEHPVVRGYIIRLNGSAKFTNSGDVQVEVNYNPKSSQ